MTCEHSLLIEPVAQVVYVNKRPYCNTWPAMVMAFCVISIICFVVQLKAVVSELKTEITGLKIEVTGLKIEVTGLNDENQRLVEKLETMNISQLKTEVAELKTEDLRLWNQAWRSAELQGTSPLGESVVKKFAVQGLCQVAGVESVRALVGETEVALKMKQGLEVVAAEVAMRARIATGWALCY